MSAPDTTARPLPQPLAGLKVVEFTHMVMEIGRASCRERV